MKNSSDTHPMFNKEKNMKEKTLNFYKKAIRKGKIIKSVSAGPSMHPLIHEGDYLEEAFVPFEDINVGELIVFMNGEELWLHRVVKKKNKVLITCGDFNLGLDSPVTKKQFISKILKINQLNINTKKWIFFGKIIALCSRIKISKKIFVAKLGIRKHDLFKFNPAAYFFHFLYRKKLSKQEVIS